MQRSLSLFVLLAVLLPHPDGVLCQSRDTSMHRWTFQPDVLSGATLTAANGGLNAALLGGTTLSSQNGWGSMALDGTDDSARVTADSSTISFPLKNITIEAWVRVDRVQKWGGILSLIQDNGGAEKGVLLGFRDSKFCFTLASKGADDGDGLLTYLVAPRSFKAGAWAHVVGTYNGKTMNLYVNGSLAASGTAQRGPILYPAKTWLELGAYKDNDEYYRTKGALHEVAVHDRALSSRDVRKIFEKKKGTIPAPVKIRVPPITDTEITGPIEKGVRWLIRMQEPDGSWRGIDKDLYHGGTPLVVYTLLKCGLSPDHPAIRTAVTLMRSHKWSRTYDLGCLLMAYEALHDPSLKSEISHYADLLVKNMGNGQKNVGARWGYPFDVGGTGINYSDLSNTQYALLGLRAARRAGWNRTRTSFWTQVANNLTSDQKAYGGFGYYPSSKPTASMTCAGITGLIVCQEALEKKGSRGVKQKVRGGINRGIGWLQDHWSVTTSTNGGWLYYYLYGLERIGSFLNTDRIGDHDWHTEGSRAIIARQSADGSWESNAQIPDTCFSLLFLRRGSRVSGLSPRQYIPPLTDRDNQILIGVHGESPVVGFIRKVSPGLKPQLVEGSESRLIWRVDGKVIHEIGDFMASEIRRPRTFLNHAFKSNGTHSIQATVQVKGEDGAFTSMDSNTVKVDVDCVEVEWHRSAQEDIPRNLLRRMDVEVQASSASNSVRRAVDGWYSKSWLSKNEDPKPWIRITLSKMATASVVKLTAADVYAGSRKHHPRAREVELIINSRQRVTVTLPDDTRTRHTIPFRKTKVRRIEVRIKSTWPGKVKSTGFKEIELLPDP